MQARRSSKVQAWSARVLTHSGSHVHCVTEEAVPRCEGADNRGNNIPNVYAGADLDIPLAWVILIYLHNTKRRNAVKHGDE